MNIYVTITFGGLIGILLHALKVMQNINKKNASTNFRMVFNEYWKSDWFTFIGSLLCFGALLFVSSEFINYQDVTGIPPEPHQDLKDKLIHFQMRNFIKVTSVIAGYFSDSIVYGFFGVAGKRLEKRFKDENEAIEKAKDNP